jgi:hypothetical protein
MRDRLVELIENIQFVKCDFCESKGSCKCDYCRTEIIADHLIENGVIVLLCKVGDRVYQTDGVRLYELEVLDVSIHKNMPYYETESIDFDTRAIGTSIFLTKAEAEQKLKEMRGG